jgi:AcrR family transcriptional regulator
MAANHARRLRADAARNRARILRAAEDLFARRGLAVTLDDVAAAAGVGVGTVYRRFANKQELIIAAFGGTVSEMAEVTDAAYADPDTWRGLTRLCEWYCEHMAADRGFGELMLELPDMTKHFAALRERIAPVVLRLIDKAVAEGVLRPGIAASDVFAMVTMTEAIASCAEPAEPDLWRRYLGIILDGLRAEGFSRQPLAVPRR